MHLCLIIKIHCACLTLLITVDNVKTTKKDLDLCILACNTTVTDSQYKQIHFYCCLTALYRTVLKFKTLQSHHNFDVHFAYFFAEFNQFKNKYS